MKLRFFLTFLIFFPNLAIAFPVDLTRLDAFIRKDFKQEWLFDFPAESANYRKIPASESGVRSILLSDYSDLKIPKFFPLPVKETEVYTIIIPFELKAEVTGVMPALYLGGIGENWEIYLNGHLIHKEVHVSDSGKVLIQRSLKKEIFPVQVSYFKKGKNFLTFKIIGNPGGRSSGLFSGDTQILDDFTSLSNKKFKSEITAYLLIPLLFFIGTFHLYLFFRTFRFIYQFYFSVFLILYSGFFFLQSTLAYTVFYDTKLIFVLESVALFVSELLIVFFLESIFIEKISLFGKLNGVITLIISSSVLIAPQFGPFCHDVFYFTELMMAIWVFYILVIGLHRSYKNIFSSNNFGSSIREKFRCFVRTLFTTLPGNVSFGFFATLTAVLLEFSNYYIFHIQTYLFLQTITAFLIGMNLVLVNRFETAIRNEAMTEVKIEEEKKRFELEKELSLVKEREKIYGDIHDHLGSKLVDIQMMLRRFHENKIPEVQVLEHMNRLVNSTIGSLKERLINLEDYELFQSDFINGIHLILIRRYSGAGKILEYWGDPSLSARIKNFSEKWKKEFHAIIGEFVTNDLKYGKGKSTWKISITNMDGIEKLELNFVSGTDYTKSGLFSGRGTESINSRLQNISGENLSKLENDVFHGKILISI